MKTFQVTIEPSYENKIYMPYSKCTYRCILTKTIFWYSRWRIFVFIASFFWRWWLVWIFSPFCLLKIFRVIAIWLTFCFVFFFYRRVFFYLVINIFFAPFLTCFWNTLWFFWREFRFLNNVKNLLLHTNFSIVATPSFSSICLFNSLFFSFSFLKLCSNFLFLALSLLSLTSIIEYKQGS